MIRMLTMFPRQDVGAKGSQAVQEPVRQPVLTDVEHGGFWEMELFRPSVFLLTRSIYNMLHRLFSKPKYNYFV